MDSPRFILRRGTAIEILSFSDRLVIPRFNLSTSDILNYGRLLGFENDFTPVFIVDLPSNRLPKPIPLEQSEKEKAEGKEPTFKLVPALTDGEILTRPTLKKAEAANRVPAQDMPFLLHALTHSEGNVRLPRLATQPGGDGPLLLGIPAEIVAA